MAFPKPVCGLTLFVVPFAFVSTLLAEVLLRALILTVALYGCAFAAALALASRRAWRATVHQYSSASS